MFCPELITRAYLILTNRCQLRCRYCWTKKDEGNMSLVTALAAVNFITRNADMAHVVPEIYLFGGEPLLRWNETAVPIIDHIRDTYKKPCQIGITSNCVLLDEEKLSYLRQNKVGLLVSMDGAKHTHDCNRPFVNGRGSFDTVLNKVPLILKYYPNIAVRMTLTPETAGTLADDVAVLLHLGFRRVECVPNIFVAWPDESIHQLKRELRWVSNDYIDYFESRGPGNGFHEFEKGLLDIKSINTCYEKGLHRESECVRCGIGIDRQAAINHLGDLYPCHEANYDQALCIGNVFDGPDAQKRIKLSCQYAQDRVRGLNCDSCRFDHVCNGGCAIFNYMISRDFNRVPQMTCVWKQALIDESEYILDQMAQRKCVAFRDYFRSL